MIKLENLTKQFMQKNGTPFNAVDNINLDVPEGEICVLLGPSGCGKTTTLKMINRLIEPTGGTILINGEDTSALDTVSLRRKIGYVIQQIGLFPNMTIEENITVVPRMLGWDKKRCHDRAEELMSMVALDPKRFLHRYPKEMSGGQQQRIGVIRALAADPPVLLMDEPFGAVDPINRETIQNEFLDMQRQLKKTVMLVSHDIDEALKLGDRIAVFRQGKIVQNASADDVLSLAQPQLFKTSRPGQTTYRPPPGPPPVGDQHHRIFWLGPQVQPMSLHRPAGCPRPDAVSEAAGVVALHSLGGHDHQLRLLRHSQLRLGHDAVPRLFLGQDHRFARRGELLFDRQRLFDHHLQPPLFRPQ